MEKLGNGQLRSWLYDASDGNEQARDNLHCYIYPRLLTRTRKIFPSDPQASNLVDLTLHRIDTKLEDLVEKVNGSRRTVSNTFIDWCFSQLRQTVVAVSTDRHLQAIARHTIGDFIPDYEKRVEQIISELPLGSRRVVRPLVFNDQTIPEVAERLTMSEASVRQSIHRGRIYIEQELFTPFEISRVSGRKDRKFQDAVFEGRLEGFKFLNFWYTDEQAIERYTQKRQLKPERKQVIFKSS